jgi:hypothetical protein
VKRIQFVILPLAVAALAACQSEAEKLADATEDRIEQQADKSAAAAGDAVAALGLTERQLLDGELVTADGTELGDIEQVRRDAGGAVTSLVVEIEDSSPDRYVDVPLAGLTVRFARLHAGSAMIEGHARGVQRQVSTPFTFPHWRAAV